MNDTTLIQELIKRIRMLETAYGDLSKRVRKLASGRDNAMESSIYIKPLTRKERKQKRKE